VLSSNVDVADKYIEIDRVYRIRDERKKRHDDDDDDDEMRRGGEETRTDAVEMNGMK